MVLFFSADDAKLGRVVYTRNSSTEEAEAGELEVNVLLSYILNWRPPWAKRVGIPVNTWLSNILLFCDCIKNHATSSTMSMLSRTAYIHVSQP